MDQVMYNGFLRKVWVMLLRKRAQTCIFQMSYKWNSANLLNPVLFCFFLLSFFILFLEHFLFFGMQQDDISGLSKLTF